MSNRSIYIRVIVCSYQARQSIGSIKHLTVNIKKVGVSQSRNEIVCQEGRVHLSSLKYNKWFMGIFYVLNMEY